MKKRMLIFVVAICVLNACHIYRDYELPAAVVVSDSLYRRPVPEDTVSLASLSWKVLFTDPQLRKLIEDGLACNTDLRIARLKVKETEALLMTSRLSSFTVISFARESYRVGCRQAVEDL